MKTLRIPISRIFIDQKIKDLEKIDRFASSTVIKLDQLIELEDKRFYAMNGSFRSFQKLLVEENISIEQDQAG